MRTMSAEERSYAEKRGVNRGKGLIFDRVDIFFESQATGPLKMSAYFRPSLDTFHRTMLNNSRCATKHN